MIIMGIDPGTINAGYGVIRAEGSRLEAVAYGVVRGGSRDPSRFGERLKAIFHGLLEVIQASEPDCVVLETTFYNKNVESAIKMGEGRGIAVLAAAESGRRLLEVSPAVVKKAVTGRGNATKAQVQEMVRVILGLEETPSPLDASDALACAIAGYHRLVLGEKIRGAM